MDKEKPAKEEKLVRKGRKNADVVDAEAEG